MGMTCWDHYYDGPGACPQCKAIALIMINSSNLTTEQKNFILDILDNEE